MVQWDRTGGSNQLWRPELAGNGVYKIKSLHAPGMCLGIKNQDVDDGGKLEIFDNDNPSMYWRIEGYVPK